MAMDRALTEAMCEIEELHKFYDEQERVIKDRDDLIAELLGAEDNEDDSDSDSGLDYEGDDDGGAEGDTKEDPKEVPKGDAPQEHAPQLEPMVEEVPQEEAPHQVIEPQTILVPAPFGLPRLYMQLM
jgi:hypothetical protein